MKLKPMNSKAVKQLLKIMENQWGFEEKLDYHIFKSEKDNIYLLSRDLEKFDYYKLKINAMGLYFGEYKNNLFRLSIEGSQLIGPKCNKNVVEVTKEELSEWLKGEELKKEGYTTFVIIKHGKDYFGTGKGKDDKILNYVPKTRRVKVIPDSQE